MLPNSLVAFAGFLAATLFFTCIGTPLARAAAPRGVPALGLAPALGWAVFNVLALPILGITGFHRAVIAALAVFALVAAWALWPPPRQSRLPPWALPLAALMAWLPATAILPKLSATGILLAPPIFDHAKIAIVDAVLRNGLPVPNPFFGPGGNGELAYYYLWHVGTAMFACVTGISGWGAEIAMTGFTAFASICLVMSLASALGAGRAAVAGSALLLLPGSLRPLLAAAIGWDRSRALIPGVSDIGGWLNQAAWAPQHLAGASCVLLSALLLIRLAGGAALGVAACLAATIAAGFETSIWVGGVQFALAGTAISVWFLANLRGAARLRYLAWAAAAALAAALLILPLAMAELHLVQARQMSGIALAPYHAIGAILPLPLRLWLDPLAFPFLLLFLFPALLPLGLAGLGSLRRSSLHPMLICGAAAIATTAALRSTIDNNDLGWRAFLPALLLLAACAGPAFATLWRNKKPVAALLCLTALLGLPDAAHMANQYVTGYQPGAPATLAASRFLWQAVRNHSGPSDRIANNPDYLAAATPWPINISWALFSDRPSCYASRATGIAFAPLTAPALAETNARFLRVFNGTPQPADINALAHDDDCALAILTPADAAWLHDPFARNPAYRLVDEAPGWRIYRRTAG